MGLHRWTIAKANLPVSKYTTPLKDLTISGYTSTTKEATVEEKAKEFWYSCFRQSNSIDPDTGLRRDRFYLGMRKEEVWVRYVNYNVLALEGEEKEVLSEWEIKNGEIWNYKYSDEFFKEHARKVLKRTAFLEACPENVYTERFVESSCPIFRDGSRAREKLRTLENEMNKDDENYACDNDLKKKIMQEVEEFEAHLTLNSHQRNMMKEHRNNLGKKGFPDVLVQMDFLPFRRCMILVGAFQKP